MKIRHILLALAAPVLMLSSCGGDRSEDKARTISDYKDLTPADSMLYYFGQLRAQDYWRYASQDTTLRSRESRDQYLKGLRAGLDAARNDDAYNQGLYVGIQLAMNMGEFQRDYDVAFNRDVVINSVADGLVNDSVVDAGEANRMFRMLMERFNEEKEERQNTTAVETLAQAAKAADWIRLNDVVYAGKKVSSEGNPIREGETISLSYEVKTLDGKELDRRVTETMVVGESFQGPVTTALLTMKRGEKGTFYMSAPALFGRFMERYNVKPTDVIEVVLTPGVATPDSTSGKMPAQVM